MRSNLLISYLLLGQWRRLDHQSKALDLLYRLGIQSASLDDLQLNRLRQKWSDFVLNSAGFDFIAIEVDKYIRRSFQNNAREISLNNSFIPSPRQKTIIILIKCSLSSLFTLHSLCIGSSCFPTCVLNHLNPLFPALALTLSVSTQQSADS